MRPRWKLRLGEDFETVLLDDYARILDFMIRVHTDALVVDIDTEGPDAHGGIGVLEELRRAAPDVVLMAVTRSASRGVRKRAREAGADECFAAPVDFAQLRDALLEALEKRTEEIATRRLQDRRLGRSRFCELVGASEAMQRVYDSIAQVAESKINVIIRGESGTGKELVARAVVELSGRKDEPFVGVNCAALPENLIESELFGYEKGAFTGATESRAGQIELADRGTLFLDEIATLTLPLQTKLLRVLEDRSVKRLGGRTGKRIDFRLITATNEPLEHLIRAGKFREDLYYRIHVMPILLPPLRERQGDMALLADHFLRLHCDGNGVRRKRLAEDALSVLESYMWPGNVRELDNLIQRLVLLVQGNVIGAADLPYQMQGVSRPDAALIPEDGIDLDEELKRVELGWLKAALRRAGGSKTTAAGLLRVDVQRMKYLCRKYKI